MNFFLTLALLFMLGALIGWVLEFFYRRIVHKKWSNPGFLKGPYLPLYGFGVVLDYCICIIPFENIISQQWIVAIIKIILIGIVMTLNELIAGLIFVKKFNIRLWDYSDRKFNYMGIICPLFSFIWLITGTGYYFLLHTPVTLLIDWYLNNIYLSNFVGIFYGFLLFDLCITMDIAVKIKIFAKEKNILFKYEEFKDHLSNLRTKAKEKIHFPKSVEEIKRIAEDKHISKPSFYSIIKRDEKNNESKSNEEGKNA